MTSVASFWRRAADQTVRFVAHRYFFFCVVAFFAINAGWLALSVVYPMIFDEQYHFGLIELYSQQLSPFIANQPPEAGVFGDVTRYPSYLYHYLASFPFRVIAHFTDDFQVQVILLRLLNVAVVVLALFLYRRLLLLVKLPPPVVHCALLLFVSLPIVPFVAAHISYDPLTLLLVPAMLCCGVKALQQPEHWAGWFLGFLSLAMVSALVKFTLLPLFAIFFLVVAVVLIRRYKGSVFGVFWRQYTRLPRWRLIGITAAVVLSGGLFLERYGGNLLRYRSINPDCAQVQSSEVCLSYSPWARNDFLRQQQAVAQNPVDGLPAYVARDWIQGVINDFFVTAVYLPIGPVQGNQGVLQHLVGSAGHIVLVAYGWLFAAAGVLAVWVQRRVLVRYKLLASLLAVVVVYAGILLVYNYREYTQLASVVAVQGRYFVALLPIFIAAILLAFHYSVKGRQLKVVLLWVSCIAGLYGAGALTYILYSSPDWHWPMMQGANEVVQSVLRLIVY